VLFAFVMKMFSHTSCAPADATLQIRLQAEVGKLQAKMNLGDSNQDVFATIQTTKSGTYRVEEADE
jgi:hypothetical protein